jgi:SAM-dependent methyltransferase
MPNKNNNSACNIQNDVLPRDAVVDWKRFAADNIPSKGIHLPSSLFEEAFMQSIHNTKNDNDGTKRILELGCGCGDLSIHLLQQQEQQQQQQQNGDQANPSELLVIGVDVNSKAIEKANQKAKCKYQQQSRNYFMFLVADITKDDLADEISLALSQRYIKEQNKKEEQQQQRNSSYDFVIMQLLLSIVGTQEQRISTLRNAWKLCRPGGMVYLSCSGVSDDINPTYSTLYEQDLPLTGEKHTYLSRSKSHNDVDDSTVLYATHHFEVEELKTLLKDTGFEDIRLDKILEASSRQPDQKAYFLYCIARRPLVE